ncbi:MAG: type 2 isopentenyl-diphosphate Delta-isomerase [Rhodospirillaceae bacterium]|nr:type 2 isopentenyl-diphosphate Delta-isomerase [Rhodospirillaceae bacterium]|tara:strand:- start:1568 stop:2650 length:1083 start_codon:yes stop_codon:yes gene_type:complete
MVDFQKDINNQISKGTETRKREHIETVLNANVAAKGVKTGFEAFSFEHCALPELDLDRINLATTLYGKTLRAPILISSMTGGAPEAEIINNRLAECAQKLGLAMGLGSQRAGIENRSLSKTYSVRKVAPDILLFANLGGVQLNYGYGIDEAKRAVEMIEADALFIHLNPLQEAVQGEGDRDWRGILKKIEQLVSHAGVPIVVKEIGNGISGKIVKKLVDIGVSAIDIAGAGGTSWSEVEAERQTDLMLKKVAHSFANWGIPTAYSLIDAVREAGNIPIFASGGIRTGIDVAKAIRLGACLCGVAAPVLGPADEDSENVIKYMSSMIEELRISAFCTGSSCLKELSQAPLRMLNDWSLVEI